MSLCDLTAIYSAFVFLLLLFVVYSGKSYFYVQRFEKLLLKALYKIKFIIIIIIFFS